MTHYTITIEPDDVGGYRAYVEDWHTRAGHGATPSQAMIAAIEYAAEWIDAPDEGETE